MLIVNNNSVGASVLINDEILKRKNKHYKTLVGKTGKIYGVWEDNISVKFKDVVNNNSQYGYFYFKPNELEILDNKQTNERKNNMNTENPNNYKGNYRVAKIRFLDNNSNEMTYRIYEDGFDYVVLCHYPIPCFNRHYYGAYHFYGHVHNSFEWNLMERMKYEMVELFDKPCNMFNVGCMISYMDFTPRTFEQIIDSNVSLTERLNDEELISWISKMRPLSKSENDKKAEMYREMSTEIEGGSFEQG